MRMHGKIKMDSFSSRTALSKDRQALLDHTSRKAVTQTLFAYAPKTRLRMQRTLVAFQPACWIARKVMDGERDIIRRVWIQDAQVVIFIVAKLLEDLGDI